MPTLRIRRPKCRCVSRVDKLLESRHTRLVTGLFSGMVAVATELKADAPRRTRPAIMVASFCPFCGKEYPRDEAKVESPSIPKRGTAAYNAMMRAKAPPGWRYDTKRGFVTVGKSREAT